MYSCNFSKPNPRPTWEGSFIAPSPIFFLDICQTNKATTNAKLPVPFGPTILHPNKKFVSIIHGPQMSQVTSCPGGFDAKSGSTGIALLDAVFKFQPIYLHELTKN